VINLSLQFKPKVDACSEIPDVCRAIRRAVDSKAVVVVAAGNGPPKESPSVSYPAAVKSHGVLAVGATTQSSCLADYSHYGEGLDLVAPGGGDDTAWQTANSSCGTSGPRHAIRQFSVRLGAAATGSFRNFGVVGLTGTSMAAAHASGVAALVRSEGTTNPAAIEDRLECTARKLGPPAYYGQGLLDAAAATSAANC
jgi:serine protease